jgi:hypothetical protein
MVYFNQAPSSPRSPEELAQWSKVLEFQKNFPKEGLWWPYKGKRNFEEVVRNHLTVFLKNLPQTQLLSVSQPQPEKTAASELPTATEPARNASIAGPQNASKEQLRRMQVRAAVLARRLKDIRDQRDRGRLDEGRFQDLTADLEREQLTILSNLRSLVGGRDPSIDAAIREALNFQDEGAVLENLAADLAQRGISASAVPAARNRQGILVSSLIDACLALGIGR